MASPYKRRKRSAIRTLWIYRHLVAAALLLGLILWFIVINSTPVTVYFPFRLGQITSTAGVIILLGALGGSVTTGLIVALVLALRHYKSTAGADDAEEFTTDLAGDRPPTDYAAKTTEGFSDAPWTKR